MSDRTADELAIRNLIARFALLADRGGDLTEYLSYLTEDMIWEYSEETRKQTAPDQPGLRLVGKAAIKADRERMRASAFQGPATKTYHLNTTLAVRFLADDRAEAESYWVYVDAKAQGGPAIRRIGHYLDTFQRTADGWKYAHRIVTPSEYLPA
jgi:ketosteroid isomerase-like protein